MMTNRFRSTILTRLALTLTLVVWGHGNARELVAQQAAPASADVGSQVRGVVKDAIGAGLAGALITLQDSRDRLWITLSDAQGRYAVDHVPSGAYTMIVASPGFTDFSTPVVVRAGAPAVVAANLKIAYSESIEVRQSLSDPHRNPSSVILSSRDVALLPAEETLFLERLAQLAGATGPDELTLVIDGFREYKRIPPTGTIEVIRINSNPFSAEYAGRSARRVEITTKAGADAFHGSGRFHLRDSDLNARAPLEPDQAPMRYRNVNGYVQGPVSKGRAAFLLYGGFWEQDEMAVIHSTIVDPATLAVQPFALSMGSPLQQTSLLGKLDFKLLNQRMNATFIQNIGRHRNRGLESGFALPEHAFETSTTENVGRIWWTTVGRRSLNDVRIQVSRDALTSRPNTTGPSIVVLNAFNGGGNQDASGRRSILGMRLIDTFTLQAGRHLFKSGVQVDSTARNSVDRAGFGGTFTFGAGFERDGDGSLVVDSSGAPVTISPIETYRRTLLGIPGYGPSQFAIVRGSPVVRVAQWNVGSYLLDDWTISKSLSVSWGVRHEVQSNVAGRSTVAPRAYLSWSMDEAGKTVMRAGSGIFYTPIDSELTFETEKLDGTRQEQIVVSDPTFFPAVPSPESLLAIAPTIYRKAADLRLPRTHRTSVGVERRLPANLWAVVEYAFDQGSNLLRSRVLPGASRVFQFESTGRSREHALHTALRGSVGKSTFYANYTLAKRQGDTDGAFTVLSDSANPALDFGALATDRRHELAAGATVVLPRDIYISPYVTFASGRPFNITTGQDVNGDTVFVDRPGFGQSGDPAAIATPYGLFTVNPQPGDPIVPRNFGRDPAQTAVNVNVTKFFRKRLAFNVDIDNLFNVSRLVGSSGVVTSPMFGVPNRSLNGRRFEFGIRYDY